MTTLVIHAIACTLMLGVIWIVQLVHYPAFEFIELNKSQKFHSMHSQNITVVVAPLMLTEFVTSVLLLYGNGHSWLLILNFFGVLAIWANTFLVMVPIHDKLAVSHDTHLARRLVTMNWFRTLIWSMRWLILIFMIYSKGV